MKTFSTIFKVVSIVYILICTLIYFYQENIIFSPTKIAKSQKHFFQQEFEEMNFKMKDGKSLNGILFKSDSCKGLIFYLHGNAGSLKTWGEIASTYTDLNYDVFMLDYRGFGKSEGQIKSEEQFFTDIESVYNEIQGKYGKEKIIILGYSIGTFAATKLASKNNVKRLILQAPYYSLTDLMQNKLPFIPTFISKYRM